MTDEMKRIREDVPDWTGPDENEQGRDETEHGRKEGRPHRTVLLSAAWALPVIRAAIARR